MMHEVRLLVGVTILWSHLGHIRLSLAEDAIDCYYQSTIEVQNANDTDICKSGYFRLPDIFKDEEFEDHSSTTESKDSIGFYCCPTGGATEERLGASEKVFFWPNELKGTLSRAFLKCHASNIPGLDTIRFLLYTKKTLGLFDYEELYLNDISSIIHSGFMTDAPVKIIIHGFMSSAFVGPAPALRAAYASIPDKVNIIVVHWEALANLITVSDGICYDIATKSTKHVGRKTAQMIEFLVNNNYTTLDQVHVLGHSLGSHCAGFTGKYLTIGRLPRITAFDPARPNFGGRPAMERLDYTDAEFVDVIHTATKQWKLLGTLSLGFLPFPVGIKYPMGHSDFYPNLGTHQPGCILQFQKLPALCSHSRSYVYYADSVRFRHERIFLAVECNNVDELEKGSCSDVTSKQGKIVMGEYTPIQNDTRKIFYVKTNARSPFPITLIKNS